jgi:hypothetical protein
MGLPLFTAIKRAPVLVVIAMLSACAGYGGRDLKPGEADSAAVERTMGPPGMVWTDPDGSRQLAYPRGPQGAHTYMVRLGPDGKLKSIDNVLTNTQFARIQPGMDQPTVLRLIGPVTLANGETYYARRDELVWEWRYCDDWNQLARFYVLFDGTARTVRSTMSLPDEDCGRFDSGSCWCGH